MNYTVISFYLALLYHIYKDAGMPNILHSPYAEHQPYDSEECPRHVAIYTLL